ncbi:MAG TPA: DUF308 domain-containing protein [Candidatus Ventricola gallistercoris]|nr:DUF308 domain-containing protein [Candidatus Ventricola gallistercoris]
MKIPDSPLLRAAREIKMSFTFSAIACLVIGLVLLLLPNLSQVVLCTTVGIVLVVYGVFNIISFLMERGPAYTLELLIGIAATALGIFSLINPAFLMSFLFTVLGVLIMVGSICGIRRALNLRAFGFAQWWAAMLSSCATLLLALSIVLFPGVYGNMLMMVIGILLIVESVSDLLAIRRLSHFSRNL